MLSDRKKKRKGKAFPLFFHQRKRKKENFVVLFFFPRCINRKRGKEKINLQRYFRKKKMGSKYSVKQFLVFNIFIPTVENLVEYEKIGPLPPIPREKEPQAQGEEPVR